MVSRGIVPQTDRPGRTSCFRLKSLGIDVPAIDQDSWRAFGASTTGTQHDSDLKLDFKHFKSGKAPSILKVLANMACHPDVMWDSRQ